MILVIKIVTMIVNMIIMVIILGVPERESLCSLAPAAVGRPAFSSSYDDNFDI